MDRQFGTKPIVVMMVEVSFGHTNFCTAELVPDSRQSKASVGDRMVMCCICREEPDVIRNVGMNVRQRRVQWRRTDGRICPRGRRERGSALRRESLRDWAPSGRWLAAIPATLVIERDKAHEFPNGDVRTNGPDSLGCGGLRFE